MISIPFKVPPINAGMVCSEKTHSLQRCHLSRAIFTCIKRNISSAIMASWNKILNNPDLKVISELSEKNAANKPTIKTALNRAKIEKMTDILISDFDVIFLI